MTDKKLISFNKERAFHGDFVVTREGYPVTICSELRNDMIAGIIHFENHDWVAAFKLNGEATERRNDLFIKPKVKTMWIAGMQHPETKDIQWSVHEEKEDAVKACEGWNTYKLRGIYSFEIEE